MPLEESMSPRVTRSPRKEKLDRPAKVDSGLRVSARKPHAEALTAADMKKDNDQAAIDKLASP